MANKNNSFWHYVKSAFKWKYRLPLLGHMPLNVYSVIAFSVLGMYHPGFWLIGAALEMAYLLFVPGDKRFQAIVDGQALLKQQDDWNIKKKNLMRNLDQQAYNRYLNLSDATAFLKNNSNDTTGQLHGWGVNQLLWTFLQLLNSRLKIIQMLKGISEESLLKEKIVLEEKLKSESPESTLYISHKNTLEITIKRIANLHKAKNDLQVIDAELDRIEKQFALFKEEITLSGSPEIMSARLDGIMQSLHETSQWLTDHKDLLDNSVDEIPTQIFTMHSNNSIKE
jgi:hypothetical protein